MKPSWMTIYLSMVIIIALMLFWFYRQGLFTGRIDTTQRQFTDTREVAVNYPLENFAGVTKDENNQSLHIYGTATEIDHQIDVVKISLTIPEYLRNSMEDPYVPNIIPKETHPDILELNLTGQTVFFDPWDLNRPKTLDWINKNQPGLISIFLNTYVHVKAEVDKSGYLTAKEFSVAVIQ